MTAWRVVLTLAIGAVAVWVVLVLCLTAACRGQNRPSLREASRLVPDVLRLFGRIVRDPATGRGLRWRLTLAIAYLAMPIDLIPDFIPVIGWADDALVVILALRAVLRAGDPASLERLWPGTEDGLARVRALAAPRGTPGP